MTTEEASIAKVIETHLANVWSVYTKGTKPAVRVVDLTQGAKVLQR